MTEEVEIPDLDEGSSIDLVARWVLVLSHLYYDRGVSLVDDATYDELCRQVYEHYDELTPFRQMQIGDREAIRSTGMGVFLSWLTIAASERLAWGQEIELGPYAIEFEYECEVTGCGLTTIRG